MIEELKEYIDKYMVIVNRDQTDYDASYVRLTFDEFLLWLADHENDKTVDSNERLT